MNSSKVLEKSFDELLQHLAASWNDDFYFVSGQLLYAAVLPTVARLGYEAMTRRPSEGCWRIGGPVIFSIP